MKHPGREFHQHLSPGDDPHRFVVYVHHGHQVELFVQDQGTGCRKTVAGLDRQAFGAHEIPDPLDAHQLTEVEKCLAPTPMETMPGRHKA